MTEFSTRSADQHGSSDEGRAFETWPAPPVPVPTQASASPARVRRRTARRRVRIVGGVLVLAVFLVPFLVFASVYKQARTNEARPVDAIVVLGAAQFNGVPSQVFQARLDTAYELYQQGYAATIVVTGGRVLGDRFTEAEAGKTYLVDRGVPADAILMENVSHNTAASFDGVRRILEPRGADSLLVVSDGFHLYRSKLLAEHVGFEAYGYAASSSPIREGSGTELRYVVRETLAVLAWRLHLTR